MTFSLEVRVGGHSCMWDIPLVNGKSKCKALRRYAALCCHGSPAALRVRSEAGVVTPASAVHMLHGSPLWSFVTLISRDLCLAEHFQDFKQMFDARFESSALEAAQLNVLAVIAPFVCSFALATFVVATLVQAYIKCNHQRVTQAFLHGKGGSLNILMVRWSKILESSSTADFCCCCCANVHSLLRLCPPHLLHMSPLLMSELSTDKCVSLSIKSFDANQAAACQCTQPSVNSAVSRTVLTCSTPSLTSSQLHCFQPQARVGPESI